LANLIADFLRGITILIVFGLLWLGSTLGWDFLFWIAVIPLVLFSTDGYGKGSS